MSGVPEAPAGEASQEMSGPMSGPKSTTFPGAAGSGGGGLPAGGPRGARPAGRFGAGCRAVGARLGRVARRCAWAAPTGMPNRVYLRDRLVTLPLLAVVAFCSFGWACGDVRDDSAYIRNRLAPALEDLADARAVLQIAQGEADLSLAEGPAAQLAWQSSTYRTRMSQATWRLSLVAQHDVLNRSEQLEVSVVSGLVSDYATWNSRVLADADDPAMSSAELAYAKSMLCRPLTVAAGGGGSARYDVCQSPGSGSDATTIVDRISKLERELRARLSSRAEWGAGVLAAAALSAVCCALLLVGLVRTVLFLRRRFRIRLSVPLVVAALPLAAVPFLASDALAADRAQQHVVSWTRQLAFDTSPVTEAAADDAVAERAVPRDAGDPPSISSLTASIDAELRPGRLLFGDGAALAAEGLGVAGAFVIGGALLVYLAEYRRIAAGPKGAS